METIQLTSENVVKSARRAADFLEIGGVILNPTDTLYGLGADAFSDEAVERVFRIKGRPENKAVHALVNDLDMAAKYAVIDRNVEILAERLPKGKVTFVCKKRPGWDSGIVRGIDTFGFRIPDSDFCIEMVRAFGRPVTATSANRSGEGPQRTPEKILLQLGDAGKEIALVVDASEIPPSLPSTVVDLSQSHPVILREGAVPHAEVWNALRAE